MSTKRWKATKEEITEPAFEETRRCLLNSYHSYVQTHAGYIIAIVIGFLAFIPSFESFLESIVGSLIFYSLIVLIIGAFFYMIFRTIYWTFYASLALSLTFDDAIRLFNEFNAEREEKKIQYYYEKAPCTAILQYGIAREMDIIKKKLHWYQRLAIKLHL